MPDTGSYHFVWIPEYRKDLLVSEIAEYTSEILEDILKELGCEAIAVEVMPDHVHVFALCPPRLSPAYIVNYLTPSPADRGNWPETWPGIKSLRGDVIPNLPALAGSLL